MEAFGLIIILLVVYTVISEVVKAIKKTRELESYKDIFSQFVNESRPSCPKDKGYPEATLFRHVWRRAVVQQAHFAKTEQEKLTLEKIAEIAARNYYAHAPENAYGKVRLQITPGQAIEYLKNEQSEPKSRKVWDTKRLSCIYSGLTKNRKMYVGQTVREPEVRWVQHRKEKTGPYRDGADYAEWSVIRGNLSPKDLDYWEAYYIGYYDTYENGYNGMSGNDFRAYNQGKKDRQDKIASNVEAMPEIMVSELNKPK